MHRAYAFLSLLLFSIIATFSQTVQNFTAVDMNGDSHDLFSYLDQGKYVIVDVTVLD